MLGALVLMAYQVLDGPIHVVSPALKRGHSYTLGLYRGELFSLKAGNLSLGVVHQDGQERIVKIRNCLDSSGARVARGRHEERHGPLSLGGKEGKKAHQGS